MMTEMGPGRFPIPMTVLVALVLSGCSGTALLDARPTGDVALVPGPACIRAALPAAAEEEDLPVLRLPSLERWPRTMWLGGSVYALVQLNPYVGQLGVLAERKRAGAGLGYGVVCGYKLIVRGTTSVGLEVVYDASEHENEISHTGAHASRVGVGLRASFRGDEKLSPFVSAGVGQYALEFDDMPSGYDLSGQGVFLGGGVDFSPSRLFSARAELSLGLWDAADGLGGGGLAATLTLGLGAAVSF